MTWFVADARSPYGYSRVVEERATPGGVAVASFVHGPVPVSLRRAGGAGFYLSDAHSGVRGLADAAGAVTDAYLFDASGNLLERTGATDNPLLYRGEQFDAVLGQYHLRARQYDPASGRFAATDPLVGQPGDPATLHDYAYAHNDPVGVTDPTGMFGAGSMLGVMSGIGGMLDAYRSVRQGDQVLGAHLMNLVRQSMTINRFDTQLEERGVLSGGRGAWTANYQRELIRVGYRTAARGGESASKTLQRRVRILMDIYMQEGANEKWAAAGVPTKLNGFPNFLKHVVSHPLRGHFVDHSVNFIRYRGNRWSDNAAANRVMRGRSPRAAQRTGETWHHHEVVGILMLVDSKVHNDVVTGHSGGVLYWNICTPTPYPPMFLKNAQDKLVPNFVKSVGLSSFM